MVRKICFLLVSCCLESTGKIEAQPDSLRIDSCKTQIQENHSLKGIEIKGQRKLTHITDGGFVVDVSHSVLKNVGTAEDVLSHIPGLKQNEDKSFTVLGKGTPLFYINDCRVYDISELDRLQSKEIKSIEVIQQPGSKYDATAKAVILIYTLRPKGEGWGLDARSAHWYGHHYGIINDLALNYVHKGWNVFGTIHYNKGEETTYSNLSHIIKGGKLWEQRASSENYTRQYSWRGRLGMNYIFNKNHSLGVVYDIMYWNALSPNTHSEAELMSNGQLYDAWTMRQSSRSRYEPQHSLSLYYSGKIQKLSVSFNSDINWFNRESTLALLETSRSNPDGNRSVSTTSKANSLLYAMFRERLHFCRK